MSNAKKVLIACGNQDICNLLVRQLAMLGYYQITIASEGVDAIRKATDENYYLIISNHWLSGIDGWAVVQAVREHEARSGNRAIVLGLSTQTTPDPFGDAIAAGCNAFAQVPIPTSEDLQVAIQSAITAASQSLEAISA